MSPCDHDFQPRSIYGGSECSRCKQDPAFIIRELREQAEALATALDGLLSSVRNQPWDVGVWCGRSDAALRAYRGECPGCGFQRQTGGNHDDVPTGDADPNCAYREKANA